MQALSILRDLRAQGVKVAAYALSGVADASHRGADDLRRR